METPCWMVRPVIRFTVIFVNVLILSGDSYERYVQNVKIDDCEFTAKEGLPNPDVARTRFLEREG